MFPAAVSRCIPCVACEDQGNANEINAVSVAQSVHCEGVGTLDKADGRTGKKNQKKKHLTREFIAAKNTSIDLESDAVLLNCSSRSCVLLRALELGGRARASEVFF